MSPFTSQLAALRKARGLTQAELAERAGVRRATVIDLERGPTDAGAIDPRISTVEKLADALGVPLAELVERTPPKRRR